ncbi:UNVERIFIED_CONTAM: hypothetical protein Sangu_2418300 [Sesamum angustifolium]|uniref:Uncharacterized protein n=1 Tax=Sesamum angustifolium TaxID=2727405 RepID=A0AAW2KW19_9LAMI
MPEDSLEDEITEPTELINDLNAAYVSKIETNPVWSAWRDDLANTMYTDWLARR